MRSLERTVAFRRDLKRELRDLHGAQLENLLRPLVAALSNDDVIPPARRDHALTGDWIGYRDCHIRPDLILIYRRVGDDVLQLIRLGSHSELGL